MPTSARQDAPVFTEIFGKFATSQRADVGIGPYSEMSECVRIFDGFFVVFCGYL